ncbi:DNA repair protein, partial [Vibrio fortis]
AREKLQEMLNELDQKRQDRNAQELQQMESKEREDDMDALFGQKKKW